MTELSTIIKLHEKLIYKIASKFHDIDQEDLFQSGVNIFLKSSYPPLRIFYRMLTNLKSACLKSFLNLYP